jgi:hypothetical protein
MTAAFIVLISLIALLPALMLIDGTIASGAVCALLAAATVAVVINLRTGDLNRFSRLLRPTAIILLIIPGLCMLLQVVPVAVSLANPVWVSASAALERPFLGSVSMDIGATLLSFVRYSAVLACAFVTAAVTLDKTRAERVLSLLAAVAVLIAIELVSFELGYLHLVAYERAGERSSAMNIAVIGAILCCATTFRAYEHLSSTRRGKTPPMAFLAGVTSLVGFLVCLSALQISAELELLFGTVLGTGVLGAVLVIRRWRLGPLGQAGAAALAIMAVLAFFATAPARKDMDPTLASSTQTQASLVERMLSDAKWTGSGAGSFAALLPIYREAGGTDAPKTASAAAVIATEMGRPFLWACIIVLLVAAAVLFRRALLRGRDYVYAGAGAGCIVALLISAFANDGILAITASLIISSVGGLALGQSRTSSNKTPAFEELSTALDTRSGAPPSIPYQDSLHPTKTWLRIGLAAFGALLSAQAGWILLAEGYHPDHISLPADAASAALAISEQGKISKAASLAGVRGDLWAEAALAYSGQLWIDQPSGSGTDDRFSAEALKPLTQALRYSPHRGDIWLMFAALAHQYKWSNYQPSLLLKMSYYTAPSELALFPLRLHLSLNAKGMVEEAELAEMVRRDITTVLTRAPSLRPALLAAYKSALPESKAFAERVIAEIDPRYLVLVRARGS